MSPGPGKDLTGLAEYARRLSTPPDDVDLSLEQATASFGGPSMMLTSTDQARLLGMLVAVSGARRIVELGTFTGRSALAMARAMPDGGSLLTCDLSRRWTAVALEHWRRAGVADRIELRLQPALDLLRSLPPEPHLDLVFLDADKGGYATYYEEIVPRLKPGGLLVADNVLADGSVLGPLEPGSVAAAMHRYNRLAVADDRTEVVVLTVADGLSLVRRR